MKKSVSMDVKYSLTQMLYFGGFSALFGFASVYLLGKGFNNSAIGIILAIISVLATIFQPITASFADAHKEIGLRKIILSFLIIVVGLAGLIALFNFGSPVLICLFIGVGTILSVLQPILNSLAFEFEKQGITINYGLGRGLGSAAYAIVSIAIGHMVKVTGITIIPYIYLILNILLIIVVYTFNPPKGTPVIKEEELEAEDSKLTLGEFCLNYKKFMIFVGGVVLVFFIHTIINNFFIQVLRPIGGNEGDMGNAVFLAAMLELPTMGLFNVIRKRLGCSKLLIFSVIMFSVKHLITYLATGVGMIYIAQICQMGAYAIFIPASVYYVTKIIDPKDRVKGQAMVTMAIIGSGVIANLIGGVLIDAIGVHTVLLIGFIVSIIGTVICILTTEKNIV